MRFFSYIGDKFGSEKISGALRRSGAAVGNLLLERDEHESRNRRALLGLIKSILAENGEISSRRLAILSEALDQFSPEDAIRLLGDIRRVSPIDATAAAALLADLSDTEKRRLAMFLYDLAGTDGVDETKMCIADELAKQFGFPEEERVAMKNAAEAEKIRRRRLLCSGAGVLVALGVILVFILMATWLRPVAFGLIIAYAALPLEKFFERRLREERGVGHCFFRLIDVIMKPLRMLAGALRRRGRAGDVPDEAVIVRAAERRIIARATAETLLTVVVILTLIGTAIGMFAGRYMRSIEENVDARREVRADDFSRTARIVDSLNRAGDRFADLPPVRYALRNIASAISDPRSRREIGAFLLQRSGGFFSFTAGMLGMVAAFAIDLLLALVFGLFFLLKLAEFCRGDKSTGKQGEYLVRTVFNGEWLPGAGESVVGEATRLIGGMLVRLRVWVRGYLTLVLLDIVVYTLAFALIKVPYFTLAGVIAGCAVLLPVLGVALSLVFTVLLTLAFGGSGLQIALILLFYLVYAYVVEQFITYPAIIGDSLGLTALETIIVVLLGGVVAGIPGIILAVPAASVAKYLVPQIYRCWETRKRFSEKANLS
ncbi:MAG: AI-2E family transporter [Victivallaceae bacterium]|nr:AI-2E family transporter [Victivallaceae bacterium]